MRRLMMAAVVCTALFCLMTANASAAETVNPPVDEVKEKAVDVAHDLDIPPEILKAIAAHESNYRQFDDDGTPHTSPDGGIGIMQVTPDNIDMQVDRERLKTDWKYNINIGAQVLLNKWNLRYLPDINQHEKSVLEDWYFAIMAYNGLAKTNDPAINSDDTYQQEIYQRIEQASLLYGKNETYFEFPKFDIRYEHEDETMKFPAGKHYKTSHKTTSKQQYNAGDVVYIDGKDGYVNIHSGSITGETTRLWPYTPLTIDTSDPIESSNPANDFTYYKVKGVQADGYVASAYLQLGNENMVFSDPIDDKRAAALAYASMNGYIKGYDNGRFGSNEPLKREHVAVILDQILDLDAPDDYDIKASDADAVKLYREQLRKAEYQGLLGGGGKLRPNEYFTRAQMAQVMNDAFDSYYDEPESMHSFEDQDKLWNPGPVNTMYYNNVTIADPFNPEENITRSQFVLFIYRTMVL
ncbi:hypothetical protein GCM10028778_12290 [Barrientosiimonas marina]|uniref:S-layer homology domain-containing protein n=1 Tax=Lentibacillus kimchii TaxID=1542911 RepID=A0ABW2UX15_9BACI